MACCFRRRPYRGGDSADCSSRKSLVFSHLLFARCHGPGATPRAGDALGIALADSSGGLGSLWLNHFAHHCSSDTIPRHSDRRCDRAGSVRLNLLVISLAWPEMRGNEVSALFTHIVFGLLA